MMEKGSSSGDDKSNNLPVRVATEEAEPDKRAEASILNNLNGKHMKLEENSLETEPANFAPSIPAIGLPCDQQHYILQAALSARSASQDTKPPITKIVVPSSFSREVIRGTFKRVSDKQGFRIIDRGDSFLTAVHQPGLSLRRFLCCFQSALGVEQITALKLTIEQDEQHWQKSVIVKGLSGNRGRARRFLKKFGKLMEREKDLFKKVERTQAATSERETKSCQNSEIYNRVQTEEEAHGEVGGTINESSSYYTFHKILSSKSYTLGKKVSDFLAAFPDKYKDIKTSAGQLPKPLKETIDMVQTAVSSFSQQYNYGKSGNRDLMQYCRPSVEKYIFSKLYDKLIEMYLFKSQEEDAAVVAKIASLKKYKGRNMMKQLEFKEKYIVITEEEEKKGKIGYDGCVDCINKVEKTCCPGEKLGYIMQMYAEMKTTVIDFSKGKSELVAMDDQMPVFIYIMAMCTLTHPIAEMNLLFDYLRFQVASYDTEQLLVTNLQASLMYLLKEFNPK